MVDVQILDKDWVAKSKLLFWLDKDWVVKPLFLLVHILDKDWVAKSEPNRPVWKGKNRTEPKLIGSNRFSVRFKNFFKKIGLVVYFGPKPDRTEPKMLSPTAFH
jgi:hypothetical protein